MQIHSISLGSVALLLLLMMLMMAHTVSSWTSNTRRYGSMTRFSSARSAAASSSLNHANNDDSNGAPSNNNNYLVDKDTFVAAVDTLHAEMAKTTQQQQQQQQQQYAEKDSNGVKLDDNDDDETFFAIGKVAVNLDISSGNPGMDLTEVPPSSSSTTSSTTTTMQKGGLVLVSHVQGVALQAGIQTADTIVGVRCDGDFQETVAYSLEDTAHVLMGAMRHAVQQGIPEIQLELNRLIKCRYASPPAHQ